MISIKIPIKISHIFLLQLNSFLIHAVLDILLEVVAKFPWHITIRCQRLQFAILFLKRVLHLLLN